MISGGDEGYMLGYAVVCNLYLKSGVQFILEHSPGFYFYIENNVLPQH